MDIQLRRALHRNTPNPRLARLSTLTRLQVAGKRQTLVRHPTFRGLLTISGQFRMHHGPKRHGRAMAIGSAPMLEGSPSAGS